MATQASDAARTLTIAELNDRVRLGLDRNARILITSNCLETLCGEGCAPTERVLVQAELMAAFRHCQFSEDSPERDFGVVELRGRTVWMKIDLYDGHSVKGTSFPVTCRMALFVPRSVDAQSAHRLVSGRGRRLVPQSIFTSLDRATADADQTTTGRFRGAINLPGHTSNQSAQPIKPVATSASGCAELSALRNQAGFHKAPKRNQQLPGQRGDPNFRGARAFPLEPLAIPTRQFAAWLVAKPVPGKLHQQDTGPVVARLADPLVPLNASTGIRTWRQAEKRSEMTPAGKAARENFCDKHGGAICADPSQLSEPDSLVDAREGRLFFGNGCRALCLNLLDLTIEQNEALKTASDLLSQVRRNRPPVTSSQAVELTCPVTAGQAAQLRDAVQVHQRSDPRDYPCPFADQIPALTHQAPCIFFFRRGDRDGPTHAVVPCEVSLQNADHCFRVDAISLHALSAAGNKKAGRIQNISFDAPCAEQAGKPETIVPDLEAEADRDKSVTVRLGSLLELAQVRAKRFAVSRRKIPQRNLRSIWKERRNKPRPLAEFNAHKNRRGFGAGGKSVVHPILACCGSGKFCRNAADLHRIYYDLTLDYGSDDPADASVTTRVMTILLPEDY